MNEGNGYASREQLFESRGKRRYADSMLPVSGLKVRIQSLTERELSAYQNAILKPGPRGVTYIGSKMEDATRRLIALCLVDGSGQRLLNDQDADVVAEWDAADTQHLYDVCSRHCGINREDIEGLVKNSVAMAAGGSHID